ncbi:MAG: hypothetical protein JXL97_14105 [Bacteroidales bacterium]|nr:hypothetical protein [Bacteroidales bacterium]
MRIVNPLYDRAFKILMENEKIAQKIISVIIEKEVVSLELRPQEVIITDKKRNFPILRYDFKAVIRTEEEGDQVVLIEVQKSKYPDPIIRFRKYLASNYMKTEKVEDGAKALPIITIYFLGYNLPEYDTPAVIVNNCVIDATTKEPIEYKNEFVKLLTHPSYILQVERLPKQRKTKLEKLLSLFDQAKKTSDDFILDIDNDYSENLSDFGFVINHLNRAAQDEDIILELQLEEEVEKEFERLESLEKVVEKLDLEIQTKDQELQTKDQELQSKDKKLIESASEMKKLGIDIKKIAEITGLSMNVVEKL